LTTNQHTPSPAQPPEGTDIAAALLTQELRGFDGLFAAMDWAEDEIQRAAGRHPAAADILYHGFALLTPANSATVMAEFVYRSHAAELLDRLAAGTDTTAATAAEMCLACCDISQRVPLHGAAVGLYLTVWQQAFPNRPTIPDQPDQINHYLALHGSRIAELRTELAVKLRVPQRRLGAVDCSGRHHGELARCRYAQPPTADTEESPA
jgi:hypothetical protein